MAGTVDLERLDDAVVRVTLNNPDKHNAVSEAMWAGLTETFSELDADHGLRCVILRGAGDKAFSAGADISEFERTRASKDLARAYGKRVHAALDLIGGCRHPVIAQIQGLCVGGGLELAATCDLRFAADGSRFGIPIKRLGLVVAYPELEGLLRLVGYANALEILLEGRLLDSDRALSIGLVNRTVAAAELEEHVLASAHAIAEGAPLVARWHKKFARRLQNPEPLGAAELDEGFDCFDTDDFRTGYRAFLAKQKPQFQGR